ncbi:hypothetical protein CRYUN_Cryun11dG0149600 [Craigia yunnanensis]
MLQKKVEAEQASFLSVGLEGVMESNRKLSGWIHMGPLNPKRIDPSPSVVFGDPTFLALPIMWQKRHKKKWNSINDHITPTSIAPKTCPSLSHSHLLSSLQKIQLYTVALLILKMSVSLDSPEQTPNPFSRLLNSISSYDGNVMLAAVISLLLVILFVLLLHVYAKWFLAQARQRSRSSSMSVSHVFRPDRFHHFHAFTFDTAFPSSPSKGLDSSAISSIPLFVYKMEKYKHGLECVICLSAFEDNDVGRNLPKCGHSFHVECIDMWLQSHSNCPICRAPVLSNDKVSVVTSADSQVSSLESVGE